MWKPSDSLAAYGSRRRTSGLLVAPIFLALATLLVVGYQQTLTRVQLVVDGQAQTVRTHQTTVEAVLRELDFQIYPQDHVTPALSERLTPDMTITLQRARPVVVQADGQTIETRTQQSDVDQILAELDISLNPHDKVEVETVEQKDSKRPPVLHIEVQRAVPVNVQEEGSPPLHFYTTASTVGTALHQAGIVLYLADQVRPSLSSPIKPGARISIKRSSPVTIHVDGRSLRTRTHRFTVGEVLADLGVSLQGLDYVEPPLDTPLGDAAEIRVVRVREEVLVQQESIPFETQWAPDPELEIDHQKIGQEGTTGVFERRIRVRYEDEVEIDRWVEAEWVARAPQPKIINYGTKIVLRTINTASGPVEYWRKYRMYATSYNAASAGKSPDHPRYGITRLGWKMRFGIVAIDPRVIPLGSRVYIPGYGIGDAADTGGAIRGPRIDLGYDDDNLVSWHQCVDVYLLAPVPANVDYVGSTLSHPRCQ